MLALVLCGAGVARRVARNTVRLHFHAEDARSAQRVVAVHTGPSIRNPVLGRNSVTSMVNAEFLRENVSSACTASTELWLADCQSFGACARMMLRDARKFQAVLFTVFSDCQ